MKEPNSGKIIVALSGGVDSAVTAALLKQNRYQVVGVFIHFFSGKQDRESSLRAKRVAKTLGIPLRQIDARKKFKKKIIDFFIEAFEKGITPNPCVICNKEMKFRILFDFLKKEKADLVATGHYARIKQSETRDTKANNKKKSIYSLFGAGDKEKDQSYFLYRLASRELSKIIFPLGNLKKSEVKNLAKKFKLPVTGDEESQDICFLEGKSIANFLAKHVRLKPGNIVDPEGKIKGVHRGLPLYTIGQRRGIEIGGTGPYFVVGKNLKKNELVVAGGKQDSLLYRKKFHVSETSWISEKPVFPANLKVKIRYRTPPFSAIIKNKDGKLLVETKRRLRAVTPGQSAVFYKGGEILGGGTIANQ